jgi:hypothetical protein
MCTHQTIINGLRTLLSELKARESNLDGDKENCGCDVPSRVGVKAQAAVQFEDHRELCASIDGCDTTR